MWLPLQLFAVCFWAAINVLDSFLVQRYRTMPMVYNWNQSYYSVPVLIGLGLLGNVGTEWMFLLFLVGIISYAGDILFFICLKHIDVSVTNIAWVILSIFLAIGGFLFFSEQWTTLQTSGVLLIFFGIIFISLWQKRVGNPEYLLLLPILALLYTPFYLVQKAALENGAAVLTVFFWSLVGREGMSLSVPLLIPSVRRQAIEALRTGDRMFFIVNAAVIALFFGATLLTTWAYQVGPVSLVAVVGNVQPLFVLLLAGMTIRFAPALAPRELVDPGSLTVKAGCFLIAFLGLALLGLSL